MPRLAAALLLVTCSTACLPKTRSGAAATTVAGGALALTGGAMLMALDGPGVDSDHDGVDEYPDHEIECALGGCAMAGMLVVTGVILAIVGLAGMGTIHDAPPAATDTTIGVAPVAVAVVPVASGGSLPEVPGDAWSIGLAKQARNLARDGQCDGATIVVLRIEAHDASYAAALRTSPALAPCPPPR